MRRRLVKIFYFIDFVNKKTLAEMGDDIKSLIESNRPGARVLGATDPDGNIFVNLSNNLWGANLYEISFSEELSRTIDHELVHNICAKGFIYFPFDYTEEHMAKTFEKAGAWARQ